MSALKWIGFGVVGAGAAYGVAYLVRQAKLLAGTKIEYAGYNIITLTKNNASVRIDLRITNTSQLTVTKRSQHYTVFLNGQQVAVVNDDAAQALPPNQPVPVSVIVNFNPAVVLKDAWQALINGGLKNMQLRLAGRIWANTNWFPPVAIPVDATWTMNDFKK